MDKTYAFMLSASAEKDIQKIGVSYFNIMPKLEDEFMEVLNTYLAKTKSYPYSFSKLSKGS